MTEHIENIGDHRANKVIAQLRANGVDDIGAHIQKSGRQAIAHAKSKPIINPDDPAEYRRLSAELPLIEALAVHAINSVLGVETRSTVWRKHLYELAGFKRIFGEKRVAALVNGTNVTSRANPEIPAINVELRKRQPYLAFTGLEPIAVVQDGSSILLIAQSADQCFQFQCHLDFAAERLHFDIQCGVTARDDGSTDCAEKIADFHRFIYDYLCNGELRIFSAASGELLSRKDPFLPMNSMGNDEVCNADIAHWKLVAQQRREAAECKDGVS